MKNMDLLIRIPDGIISRKELMQLVIEVQPEFREGQMKRLIEYWIRMSEIERVGRDKYKKCTSGEHLKKYTNIYTDRSKKIIDEMEQKFPVVDYRIWELRWLNEFFNHQVGYNYIFLEVEHTGCEFVFDQLIVENKKILFKPSVEDVLRYATYETILLDRLVSESPKGESSAYGLSLEKLVVDLFANKKLKQMLSFSDYPQALENMFSMYKIDETKLFRYARRRNKEIEIRDFIKDNTNIQLIV